MNTEVRDQVRFRVPLPPVSLRANSRAHWAKKKKDADEYSRLVAIGCLRIKWPEEHDRWQGADAHYEWRYAGVEPDHGNLGGNTKYLQDILAVAPPLSPKQAEKYDRWHLGLVENDRAIHATYEAVKVAKRKDECVIVTVTKK